MEQLTIEELEYLKRELLKEKSTLITEVELYLGRNYESYIAALERTTPLLDIVNNRLQTIYLLLDKQKKIMFKYIDSYGN